jgi:hypothetical protein
MSFSLLPEIKVLVVGVSGRIPGLRRGVFDGEGCADGVLTDWRKEYIVTNPLDS